MMRPTSGSLVPRSALGAAVSAAALSAVALAAQSGAVDGAKDEEASNAPTSSSSAKDDLRIVPAGQAPVPTLTFVEGGRTSLGSSPKDVEELLNNPSYSNFVRILDAQTPQFTEQVDSFWIGTYELTNVEYKAFVDATGKMPPIYWCDETAMSDAMREFARVEQEKFLEAKERGQQYERRKWNDPEETPSARDRWWAENWGEVKWGIPTGEERFPVVYVQYEDAVAYCEWAGLRLPTEFEFQRAARGKEDWQFPWGDEWEDGKYANTSELRRAKPFQVGTFAEGASPYGVHDLAGNVWEWTSSPYVGYPKFKVNEYTIKVGRDREKREALPQWDPNQVVVVGGSFQEPWLASRITTRRATDRSQFTNALGFRPAASERVGLDKAQNVFDNVVKNSTVRPSGVEYNVAGVVAIDRWEVGAPGITGYDAILFAPVEVIEEASDNELRKASRESILHLGFFYSSVDLIEPALPAGTYFVAFRADGEAPRPPREEADPDKKGDAPAQEPEVVIDPALDGLDLSRDNLIFIDLETGKPAIAIEPDGLKWDRGDPGGQFSVREAKVRVGSGAQAVIEDRTYLDLEVGLAGKVRRRALPVKIALRLAPDGMGAPWRQ